MLKTIRIIFRMIKIEHSIFALPFAYIGLFLAARGWPGWGKFFWVSLAMVGIRSFAMTANRILDVEFDKKNPRTATRPLVTGELSTKSAVAFAVVCGIIFVLSCAMLNRLCLYLSLPVLIWAALYSLTKRFTSLCHFWLGSVLALAPIGGWLGFIPSLSLGIVCFALGVLFWVAGFDIIYSCQDVEFDRKEELYSLPSVLGIPPSLYISTFSHINSIIFFFLGGWAYNLGGIYFLSWIIVSLILITEHFIVTPERLEKISLVFFNLNAVVACLLCGGVLLDIFIGR